MIVLSARITGQKWASVVPNVAGGGRTQFEIQMYAKTGAARTGFIQFMFGSTPAFVLRSEKQVFIWGNSASTITSIKFFEPAGSGGQFKTGTNIQIWARR